MIEPLDIRTLATSGDTADLERFVASDYKIRSGLCPNNCGPLSMADGLQQCQKCSFCTNVLPDPPELLQ